MGRRRGTANLRCVLSLAPPPPPPPPFSPPSRPSPSPLTACGVGWRRCGATTSLCVVAVIWGRCSLSLASLWARAAHDTGLGVPCRTGNDCRQGSRSQGRRRRRRTGVRRLDLALATHILHDDRARRIAGPHTAAQQNCVLLLLLLLCTDKYPRALFSRPLRFVWLLCGSFTSGNADAQAAQGGKRLPLLASCVQSCSSVQITRLCVSPNVSRGSCVLLQNLGRDIHHDRTPRVSLSFLCGSIVALSIDRRRPP